MVSKYDYIIAGGGLSGLSIAIELSKSSLKDKKVLLIDQGSKSKNDRTWCFWATPGEEIPPIAIKTWQFCNVYSENFAKKINIAPYEYRMIRGIDFYQYADSILSAWPSISRVQEHIQHVDTETGVVTTDQGSYQADIVFKSHFKLSDIQVSGNYLYLLQHFKGWLIESEEPVFNPNEVTFMDFRTEQFNQTRFFYVLPLSSTRALIEYTIFSPQLLADEEYEQALEAYVAKHFKIKNYTILEKEFNAIPMTDYPFSPKVVGKVVHIGTVGGFVKGSSGYCFKRTLEKTRSIVQQLEKHGYVTGKDYTSALKYRFYDSIILNVLQTGLVPARKVFSTLFKQLPDTLLFRFLDERTSLLEELRVISVCSPKFVLAFLSQVKRLPSI
jgi:lycopene beta-cyclase